MTQKKSSEKQKKDKIPSPRKLYKLFFNPNYSWDAKYIIKPVSAYFTWFFLHVPIISANMLSWIMTILFGASAVFFGLGGQKNLWIGIICLLIGWVLDGADGEVAFYWKDFSIKGKYIDYISHGIFPACFFGLGLGIFLQTNNLIMLWFGASATFFHLMHNYTRFIHILIINNAELDMKKIRKNDGFIKRKLRYLSFGNFDFPWTVLILISIIAQRPEYFVYFSGFVIPCRWLVHMWLCGEYPEEKKKIGQSYD